MASGRRVLKCKMLNGWSACRRFVHMLRLIEAIFQTYVRLHMSATFVTMRHETPTMMTTIIMHESSRARSGWSAVCVIIIIRPRSKWCVVVVRSFVHCRRSWRTMFYACAHARVTSTSNKVQSIVLNECMTVSVYFCVLHTLCMNICMCK